MKYLLLHYGFEKPTPEIMGAWTKCFEATAERTVDNGGCPGGAREISKSGTRNHVAVAMVDFVARARYARKHLQ